jgi:GH15 family glucan-1,4-alpha-glucosidase
MQSYIQPETSLPKPSFDMWEEKAGVFTSTASTVCSALSSAAKFARVFYDSRRQESLNKTALRMKEAIRVHLFDERLGRFIKGVDTNGRQDLTVDSSLAVTFLSGSFEADSPEVKETMKTVVSRLWVETGVGGLARYEDDQYHQVMRGKGNPWIICTLWLARWRIRIAATLADLRKGLDLLSWVTKYASSSGVLAEQLNPYDASPISVSPLVWSHAEFVIAVCEYVEKYNELVSSSQGEA